MNTSVARQDFLWAKTAGFATSILKKHADIPVFARIRAELARALVQGDPEAAEAIVHRRMDYIESTLKGRTQTSTK